MSESLVSGQVADWVGAHEITPSRLRIIRDFDKVEYETVTWGTFQIREVGKPLK